MFFSHQLLLFILLLFIVTPPAFGYQDKAHTFSIQFPQGWNVTDQYDNPQSSGVMAKNVSVKSFIGVQHQKIKNAEKKLLQYPPMVFSTNVTLNTFKSSCPDAEILRAERSDEQGFKGVECVMVCRNFYYHDLYLAKKDEVYHLSAMHDNRSDSIQDMILNSWKTLKITKKR